jgi:transcriptional regulator with XRE-family HTH domain
MKFGEKLKKLRTDKGLTQDQVSSAISTSRRTYISYEQEGRYPRKREVYAKLADTLGCDVNYLMTEDEEFIANVSEQYGSRGKRQAEELVSELSGMFAGGELSDSDMDAVMIALQKAYFDCKEDNKKYTPKKYRKED